MSHSSLIAEPNITKKLSQLESECQKALAGEDFKTRLYQLRNRIPARGSHIEEDLRMEVGFTKNQLEALRQFRIDRLQSR